MFLSNISESRDSLIVHVPIVRRNCSFQWAAAKKAERNDAHAFIQTIEILKDKGLIVSRVDQKIPPKVEYSLSKKFRIVWSSLEI